MTTPYTPNPDTAALTIDNVTGADTPSSSLFGTAYEQCADLAACALVDQQVYVNLPGTSTWTKPAHAALVRVIAVGHGGAGGRGSSGDFVGSEGGCGGGGGGSGQVVIADFVAADVPATLTVDVASSDVTVTGTNFSIFAARGGTGSDANGAREKSY